MYIYTNIVKKFACEMCGHCCRNDWQVTVDEESYLRNEALFNRLGRQADFGQAFVKIGEGAGCGEYAYIAKQAGGGCWFLDSDNSCKLHRQAGHSHLDAVCQTFPRYPLSTARGLELTLSFSCPAVIKLASQGEALTILRADEQPIYLPEGSSVAEVFPKQQPLNSPLRYYFELEHHFIDLLQCRKLPLAERVALLVDTANTIYDLPKDDTIGSQLNRIFNSNYDALDALADRSEKESNDSVLLENFLVNFVFKKPFYLHGLKLSLRLIERMWRDIAEADEPAQTIMELEFKYGHKRRDLWR